MAPKPLELLEKEKKMPFNKLPIPTMSIKKFERVLFKVSSQYLRETMKQFTRKDLMASLFGDPNLEKKVMAALREDREMHRQVQEARRQGMKLPAWAYPPYIVKTYPDIFVSNTKGTMAGIPKKMR